METQEHARRADTDPGRPDGSVWPHARHSVVLAHTDPGKPEGSVQVRVAIGECHSVLFTHADPDNRHSALLANSGPGGLVVIPDIWGLRPLFDELCQRLADEHRVTVCAIEPFPNRDLPNIDDRFDAMSTLIDANILLDIDHSPRHVLHDPHADFYTHDGLTSACRHLCPGGAFAMWSDDPPDDDFVALLGTVFTDVEAQTVWFDNPLTRGKSAATIYLGTRSPDTE